MFSYFFMYGYGNLGLRCVHGSAEIGGGARLDQNMYTSEDEIAEENSKPRVLEKTVFI